MLRPATRVLVGVAMALALAPSGAVAAGSSSSRQRPPNGTLAGSVQFVVPSSGVVKIFHDGRLVAHREVRWGDGHFRFVLEPGRYQVTLNFNDAKSCPQGTRARVKARRTTHVRFAEACLV